VVEVQGGCGEFGGNGGGEELCPLSSS